MNNSIVAGLVMAVSLFAGAGAAQAEPATCSSVVQCYAQCTTDACIAACEAGVDAEITAESRALAVCVVQNQCSTPDCLQTRCASELSTCAGTPAPAPSRPVARAASHVQLWMGLRQTGLGSSYTASIGWYVLFDDGRVLAVMPSDGLDGFDETAHANELGAWRKSGDTIEMAFQNYRPVFSRRSDGSWTSREGTFWPASSLDGARLAGAYADRSGKPDIAFTADGRFQSNGGLLISKPGWGVSPTPAGQGTYSVRANTLTLVYSTGQVVRISITTLKSDGSSLFLGGFEYHRT